MQWGDLRRISPISTTWGFDRGTPVDRFYIEAFLDRRRSDISGRVLEVKDNGYTERYGRQVTRSDVLDVNPTNPRATIVADLTAADQIQSDSFDCFILTQTLHQIFDLRSALGHARRILKPGGVLLCSLPSVSRVDVHEESTGGYEESDFWRFTAASIRGLFHDFFPAGSVDIETFGNVLTCTAFLYGLASVELAPDELAHTDPCFPLIFCVRAVKPLAEARQGGDHP